MTPLQRQLWFSVILSIALSSVPFNALAGTSRAQPADTIVSTDLTKSFTFPSASDQLVGKDQNVTLTNKTISGLSNTITNIAVGNLSGTLSIGGGGTGQTTKGPAFDALSPMSASGDIIYGGTSGTGTRLAKGSDGQALELVSGLPAWTTLPVPVQELPSGTVNSSNVTFTLANTPTSAAYVHVYVDGAIQTQGSGKDYTISSGTITFATAPATGQTVYADYFK